MTRKRHRLTAAQREALYDEEAAKALASGRGQFPLCKLCDLPIGPGQRWHDNHDKYLPHAIGGERDGISHERCNLDHNHKHDTPLVAKVKRQRQKDIGAWRTSRPMVGSKASGIKLHMRPYSDPIDRRTGQPWRSRT